ncbi:hypothetical protein MLD38_016674 [Melastoma candidum]|uniref:Uncharacterized protein n=1 Tax=Melastoma candidum TaxID=119954 RepID=A0ACB9QMH3_9MYRT|nr:hypothetical protein MLD38_016674 [Melastoma candidum]
MLGIGMGSDEGRTFGKGPRELCGAVDLISKFKLQKHCDLFCRSSVPSSLTVSNYLGDVVGDSKIRKEEEANLDRLLPSTHRVKDGRYDISPFDLRVLLGAFELREAVDVVAKTKDDSKSKRKVKRKRNHRQERIMKRVEKRR